VQSVIGRQVCVVIVSNLAVADDLRLLSHR